jgi:osmoprotectant transport system permease protein
MIAPLLAASNGLACGAGPKHLAEFPDAISLVFKERESVSGGVCIGGLGEFGHLLVSHMYVSLLAIIVGIVVAVPVGLWLGHLGRFEFLAVSVSNVGRAVPALALLAFFVAFRCVGKTNVTVVLALLAIPPILTNTFVGVRQVNPETVDAARGQGLTEFQIVRKVELPLALPTIFAGLRTSAVAVVATATIAPLANVESLGNPILEPQTYGDVGALSAAIVVAIVTLATDAGIGVLQRVSTPRGLKVGAHQAPKRKRFSLPILNRTETT